MLHELWYQIAHFDPLTIVMVIGLEVIGGIAGFQMCKMRHRQHGIAVDKDFKVPDFPPSDLRPRDPAGV